MTVEREDTITQEAIGSSALYEEATRLAPLPRTVAKSLAKKVAAKNIDCD